MPGIKIEDIYQQNKDQKPEEFMRIPSDISDIDEPPIKEIPKPRNRVLRKIGSVSTK